MELSAKQLDAILSSMGEGLLVVDREYKVIIMNQAAGTLLRIAPIGAVGKDIEEVFTLFKEGRRLERADLPFLRVIEKVDFVRINLRDNLYCENKLGALFPLAMIVAPLLEEEISGAVIIFRDITEEKEIDQAKSEFVSMASHQLRTPLSIINWYTEMLLSGYAGDIQSRQKEFLEEIYRASQRMVELIDALLNVSRIELGTFIVQPVRLYAPDIVESVINELALPIQTKHLTVEKDFSSGIPLIQADPKLLQIVLQNIIINAIRFTPEYGKICVTVSLNRDTAGSREPLQDGNIIISVSDTGRGIPRHQWQNIFKKLFRADNVRDIDGTGLGLYIVKLILSHTGGLIWFESQEDKGSTFYVSIPLSGMKRKEGTKELS